MLLDSLGFSLHSLRRNGTFQWVTTTPNENSLSLPPSAERPCKTRPRRPNRARGRSEGAGVVGRGVHGQRDIAWVLLFRKEMLRENLYFSYALISAGHIVHPRTGRLGP